jgi:hypothetical protein
VETLQTITIKSLLSKLTSSTKMSNVLKSTVEVSSARELSQSKLLIKFKKLVQRGPTPTRYNSATNFSGCS